MKIFDSSFRCTAAISVKRSNRKKSILDAIFYLCVMSVKNIHRNWALILYNMKHKLTVKLLTASGFTSSVLSYINHFCASMETEALLFWRRKCMCMLCVLHINYPGVLTHPGGFLFLLEKQKGNNPRANVLIISGCASLQKSMYSITPGKILTCYKLAKLASISKQTNWCQHNSTIMQCILSDLFC